MRLGQLHDWLGRLIAHGADENLPVCLAVDGAGLPAEVDRAVLAAGACLEDVSPHYAGFMQREGVMFILASGTESLEPLQGSHTLVAPEPDAPVKSWPTGDWRR
ncbi:hypothetical protein [Klebsiella aerogenes]|uniref:hypothetical protein n=1 Tax=Klebsiella aerogenes TaxID=548 RepID=UPI002FF4E263